jgi:hypothetical protein
LLEAAAKRTVYFRIATRSFLKFSQSFNDNAISTRVFVNNHCSCMYFSCRIYPNSALRHSKLLFGAALFVRMGVAREARVFLDVDKQVRQFQCKILS